MQPMPGTAGPGEPGAFPSCLLAPALPPSQHPLGPRKPSHHGYPGAGPEPAPSSARQPGVRVGLAPRPSLGRERLGSSWSRGAARVRVPTLPGEGAGSVSRAELRRHSPAALLGPGPQPSHGLAEARAGERASHRQLVQDEPWALTEGTRTPRRLPRDPGAPKQTPHGARGEGSRGAAESQPACHPAWGMASMGGLLPDGLAMTLMAPGMYSLNRRSLHATQAAPGTSR